MSNYLDKVSDDKKSCELNSPHLSIKVETFLDENEVLDVEKIKTLVADIDKCIEKYEKTKKIESKCKACSKCCQKPWCPFTIENEKKEP